MQIVCEIDLNWSSITSTVHNFFNFRCCYWNIAPVSFFDHLRLLFQGKLLYCNASRLSHEPLNAQIYDYYSKYYLSINKNTDQRRARDRGEGTKLCYYILI